MKLADGQQHICQFYPRESVHLSHTPQVQAALNKYSAQSFDPSTSFGAYIDDEEDDPTDAPAAVKLTKTEQVYRLLEQDNNLSAAQLAHKIGCDQATAFRARKKWKESRR